MRQESQSLPYELVLGVGVVSVSLGAIISVGTALLPVLVSATGSRRFRDIGYLTGAALIALGMLLVLLWGGLFGLRYWRRRQDGARRGFTVLPRERADSAR
jgi:hypothetical protein